MFAYLNDYFQNAKPLVADERALRKIGLLGYFIGIFSLFISMRIAEIAVGSYISFMFFFTILIMIAYSETAVITLFLDVLGHKGSSSALFYLFGFTNLLWLFLLPLVFLSKFMDFQLFPAFLAIFLAIVFVRLKLIKETFSVGYKTAIISFFAPYVLLCALAVLVSAYSIYWLFDILG